MFQADLIEKCRQNSRKAQLALYGQYGDAMFAVAMRYLKNREDAEDAVQEAFIKMFRKLDQYRREVAFGAWLKRIVVNHCLDRLKTEREQLLSLEGLAFEIADEEEEGWMVDDSVSPQMVARAIERLPENCKYVTMLYLVEGYDHEEISGILGITEINSRTLLFRGKKKLRDMLSLNKQGTEKY